MVAILFVYRVKCFILMVFYHKLILTEKRLHIKIAAISFFMAKYSVTERRRRKDEGKSG